MQTTYVSQNKKVTAIVLRAIIGASKVLLTVEELAYAKETLLILNIYVIVFINVLSRTEISKFQYLKCKTVSK